jgi:hypothetical protein
MAYRPVAETNQPEIGLTSYTTFGSIQKVPPLC